MKGRVDNTLLILWSALLVLIALHVLAHFIPAHVSWAFGFWRLQPVWLTVTLLSAVGILGSPPVLRSAAELIGKASQSKRSESAPTSTARLLITVAILGSMGVGLYVFRVQTLLYGDSATILSIVTSDEPDLFLDQLSLQPLSMLLHHVGVRALSGTGSMSPQDAFSVISVLGGIVGLGAIWMLTGLYFTRILERVAASAATFTSGAAILFFGHIENYTWAISSALWAMYFVLIHTRGRYNSWLAILAAVLAIVFHAVTIPFLAAIVSILILTKSPWAGILRPHVLIPLTFLGSAAAASAWFLLGNHGVLVSPWPTEYSPYWAFSRHHLSDMANLLMLMAPLVIAWLLTFARRSKTSGPQHDRQAHNLLLVFALFTFVGVFWIDPEIGAARDFDLLAICGVPITLWCVVALMQKLSGRIPAAYFCLWMVLIVIVQLTPNLLEKTNPDLAARNLDDILWHDPHYSPAYNEAQVALSWGFLLTRYGDSSDRPMKYFRRRLEAVPDSDAAAAHLGDAFLSKGDLQSAEMYHRMAVLSAPDDAMNWSRLSNVLVALNRLNEAIQAGRTAISKDPELVTAHTALGIALFRKGLSEEACPILRKAYQLQPDSAYSALNLGLCFYGLQQFDSALVYLQIAQSNSTSKVRHFILETMFHLYLERDEYEKARFVIDEISRVGGKPDLVQRLRQHLQELSR